MNFRKREARKDLYKLVKKFSRDVKRVESFSFSSFKLGWKSKKKADSALRNTLSFVREHHFVLGFLFLALVAGAMGGLYNSASKKLAERPEGIKAAPGDINWSIQPGSVATQGSSFVPTGAIAGTGQDIKDNNITTFFRGSAGCGLGQTGSWNYWGQIDFPQATRINLVEIDHRYAWSGAAMNPLANLKVSLFYGGAWNQITLNNIPANGVEGVSDNATGWDNVSAIKVEDAGACDFVSGVSSSMHQTYELRAWGPPADSQPPVRSNGAPSGSLPSGTTQTNISLTTNENATCRYSATSGTTYAAMTNTFSTTGGTSHSSNVTGLADGGSYNYYVRCQDAAGNANTDDYPISFSVAAPPIDFSLSHSGGVVVVQGNSVNNTITATLVSGTTQPVSFSTSNLPSGATASFAPTNCNPTCSTTMTISTDVSTPPGTYFPIVTGVGGSVSRTTSFFLAVAGADSVPPVRSNGTPSGVLPVGTSEAYLTIDLDEMGDCRYSTTAGVSYGAMTNNFWKDWPFDTHLYTTPEFSLTDGTSYTYYVRCQDLNGNVNPDDYIISFSVAPQPVTRSNGAPIGVLPMGTAATTISLDTSPAATCKYDIYASTSISTSVYDAMPFTLNGGGTTAHSANVNALENGNNYNYFIRCRDASSNTNTADYRIAFDVDDDNLLWSLNNNPSASYDDLKRILVDNGSLYVVGKDTRNQYDSRWRIEKRDASTGALEPAFGSSGVIQENLLVSDAFNNDGDIANDAAVAGGYLYVVGNDWTPGTSPAHHSQARIEKRTLVTGALVSGFGTNGVVTFDWEVGNDDLAQKTVADASGLYVASYSWSSVYTWHIQKLDLNTGGEIWSQASSNGTSFRYIYDMAVDATSLYILGEISPGPVGSTAWRIEKRRLDNGNYDPAFGTNGVLIIDPGPDSDYVKGLAIDSSGLYVVGRIEFGFNTSWLIKKLNLNTGAEIWSQSNNLNLNGGLNYPWAAAVDANALYVVGRDKTPGYYRWRIEKRDLNDGNIIYTKTEDVLSGLNSEPYSIAIDGSGYYIGGFSSPAVADRQWRIEKRSLGVAAGFTCGSNLIDSRDGTSYPTVQIDTQCWMAQNLNYGARINGAAQQGIDCSSVQKYCYQDNSANCTSDGGLYQWHQAACTAGGTTICPAGWHLPTDSEWHQTVDYLKDAGQGCNVGGIGWGCASAGAKLKQGGSSGFNALLTGRYSGGSYINKSTDAFFWTATEYDTNNPGNRWRRRLAATEDRVNRNYNISTDALSVRCVLGAPPAEPPSASSGGTVTGYAYSNGTGWIKFSSSTLPVGKREKLENENQLVLRGHSTMALAGDSVSRLFKQVKLSLFGVPSLNQGGREILNSIRRFIAAAGTVRRQLAAVFEFGIKIALAQAMDYGVNIDTDGQFSGYAWSDAVGWVYFGPDDNLPVYGPIASSSAPDDPKYWAKWSKVKDQPDSVTGWANILALGNDGWIKMSDDPRTVAGWNGNGVKILSNGDFEGWAWNAGANGSAGIGWISFNASSTGNPPGGPDYKASVNLISVNNPPVLSNLSATHWSKDDARAGIARRAFLWWNYSDPDDVPAGTDPQAQYQVIVTKAGSPAWQYDSTELTGNASQFMIDPTVAPGFEYGTPYRWQVTVWDSNGASITAEYNSPQDDPLEIDDGNPDTFTTFSHEFPEAKFTWTPANPSPGQSVEFDGQSSTVDSGYNIAEYRWDFINMVGATPSYGATTSAQVDKAGTPTIISLTITDNAGYSDTATTTFTGKLKLPSWREVK